MTRISLSLFLPSLLATAASAQEIADPPRLVDGNDPIEPCLKWIERDTERTLEISRCVQRTLSGLKNADAMRAQGRDAYLVLILKRERDKTIQGWADLLTPQGQVVDSDVYIAAITQDGNGRYQAALAPPDSTFIVGLPFLGERAARWGIKGIPLHQPFRFAPGNASFWGSAVLTPQTAP